LWQTQGEYLESKCNNLPRSIHTLTIGLLLPALTWILTTMVVYIRWILTTMVVYIRWILTTMVVYIRWILTTTVVYIRWILTTRDIFFQATEKGKWKSFSEFMGPAPKPEETGAACYDGYLYCGSPSYTRTHIHRDTLYTHTPGYTHTLVHRDTLYTHTLEYTMRHTVTLHIPHSCIQYTSITYRQEGRLYGRGIQRPAAWRQQCSLVLMGVDPQVLREGGSRQL
jgi:hypothetical protein